MNWLFVAGMICGGVCALWSVYLYTLGALFESGLFLLIGLLVVVGLEWRPLFIQPKSIDFSGQGIELFLSIGRRRTIKWNRIAAIYAWEGDPQTALGRFVRKGAIKETGKSIPIDLSYELALVVKDQYWKRFGDEVNKVWKFQKGR
jgi:hypothetical protein